MPSTKWEYYVAGFTMGKSKRGNECWVDDEGLGISDSLADAGNEGWELVTTIKVETTRSCAS